MIIKLPELVQVVNRLKQEGKRIVFTNGCFDIIHMGHVLYLKKAREYGDVLVAGLNSDISIKIIKGDKRPVVPEAERAEVLSSIRFVDYVVIFNEPDPFKTIEAIKPDVLVKGGDWAVENIIGRDVVESFGGKVYNIPYIEGSSSTNIIEEILKRYGKD